MSFEVAAQAYGAFMGRFSTPLAPVFADFAGIGTTVPRGARALDVGCGPGALTAVLVDRLGAEGVAAVDPSPPFVAAARDRFPGLDVRQARAEELPFAAGTFDAVVAQLVVHFLRDPVAGLGRMLATARPGGTVAACVWDHAGGTGPLAVFWDAVRAGDPDAPDESDLPGAREGHLAELLTAAGGLDVATDLLSVEVRHTSFEDWWEPYTLGVGPAGDHVRRLDDAGRAALRDRCRERLPDGAFTTVARAWAVRARRG